VSLRAYYPELDIIKGACIMLVILGHCLCRFPIDLDAHFPVFGIIPRSFEIPLFFMVSGFLLTDRDGMSQFLKKKTMRILMPWLAFSLVSLSLRYAFAGITHSATGEQPLLSNLTAMLAYGRIYWFLYTLFLVLLLNRLLFRWRYWMGALCLVSTLAAVPLPELFSIDRVVAYDVYFCIGLLLRPVYCRLTVLLGERGIALVGVMAAVAYLYIFTRQDTAVMKLLTDISGGTALWCASLLMVKAGVPSRLLSHFGKYSLQYYLTHLLIMLPIYYAASLLTWASPWLVLAFIFVTAVAATTVGVWLECRSRWVRKLAGVTD
jgi:fucose 4-O-acetylase-like acetyltransferase